MKIADVFKCHQCGKNRIEEIMTDVTVASKVLAVDGDSDICEYGYQTNEGGTVDRYQCDECGWIIPDVHNAEQLAAWLELMTWAEKLEHNSDTNET